MIRDNSQGRKWNITVNNPHEYGMTHDYIIEQLNILSLDYYCLSDEIGEQGTYHTHIFIYSTSTIRFSTLKNKFPIAHIEKAYGSAHENKEYILKTGKWANSDKHETSIPDTFIEWGNIPSPNDERAPQMNKVIQYLKDGRTTASIIEEFPNLAFQIKNIDTLRETILSEKYRTINREVEVSYVYGSTGMGKTHDIFARHSPLDICRITTYSRDRILFDAYHGHDVLVLEEFHSQVAIADMLNYLDIYPLTLPARYSDRTACYTKVYITSNIPLSQQYKDIQIQQPDVWEAFIRRINHIVEYVSMNDFINHRKEEFYVKPKSEPKNFYR